MDHAKTRTKTDPFAGSVLFGAMGSTSSPNVAAARQSPISGTMTSSPQFNSKAFATTSNFTSSASKNPRVRRPPLSSVLDDDKVQKMNFLQSPPLQSYETSDVHRTSFAIQSPFDQTRSTPKFTSPIIPETDSMPFDRSLVASQTPLLEPFAPAVDRMEAAWSCWVVVYGYQTADDLSGLSTSAVNHLILKRFAAECGGVDSYVPSNGNWIFIKFDCPMFAERAVLQNMSFLNSHVLLGVSQMNCRIARYMNVQLSRDGQLVAGEISAAVAANIKYSAAVSDSGRTDESLDSSDSTALRNRKSSGRTLTVTSSTGGRYQVPLDSDEDLYLKPQHRSKNICERIVEFLFNY